MKSNQSFHELVRLKRLIEKYEIKKGCGLLIRWGFNDPGDVGEMSQIGFLIWDDKDPEFPLKAQIGKRFEYTHLATADGLMAANKACLYGPEGKFKWKLARDYE